MTDNVVSLFRKNPTKEVVDIERAICARCSHDAFKVYRRQSAIIVICDQCGDLSMTILNANGK